MQSDQQGATGSAGSGTAGAFTFNLSGGSTATGGELTLGANGGAASTQQSYAQAVVQVIAPTTNNVYMSLVNTTTPTTKYSVIIQGGGIYWMLNNGGSTPIGPYTVGDVISIVTTNATVTVYKNGVSVASSNTALGVVKATITNYYASSTQAISGFAFMPLVQGAAGTIGATGPAEPPVTINLIKNRTRFACLTVAIGIDSNSNGPP